MEVIIQEEKMFACPECGKKFNRQHHLERHSAKHTGKKNYECAECGKTFGWQTGLKRHLKAHTGVKDFQCLKCGERFGQRSSLKVHDLRVHGEKKFQCEECGQRFVLQHYLKRHMTTVHSDLLPHVCDKCGKRFIKSSRLKRHSKVHIPRPVLLTHACTKCDAKFRIKKDLSAHMRVMHPPPKHECPICRKFMHEYLLERHALMHSNCKTNTKKEPPRCIKCDREFESKSSLDRHLQLCDLLMLKPGGGGFISTTTQETNDNNDQASCSKTQPMATISLKLSYPEFTDSVASFNGKKSGRSKCISKAHKCQQCDESFLDKQVLDAHVLRHHRVVYTGEHTFHFKPSVVGGSKLERNLTDQASLSRDQEAVERWSFALERTTNEQPNKTKELLQRQKPTDDLGVVNVALEPTPNLQYEDQINSQPLNSNIANVKQKILTPSNLQDHSIQLNNQDSSSINRDKELHKATADLGAVVDFTLETNPINQINNNTPSSGSIINVKQETMTSSVCWPPTPNSQDEKFIKAVSSSINKEVAATTTLACVVCGEPAFTSSLVDRFKPHNVGMRYLCPECDVHLESANNVDAYFRKAAFIMHNW